MQCSCKHRQEEIYEFYEMIDKFKDLFIKRMTVDSDTQDRRRKDFNQAIFNFESNESVDSWNQDCERFGLQKKQYGSTYPVFEEIDLQMVLQCFDDAIKDYRRTFCDTEDCRRK